MLDQTFILVGVLALIVLSLAVFLVRRIQRVPPNEALVVVGTRGAKDPDGTGRKSYRIVTSGRTFVWPILEQAYSISLEQRAITFKVSGPDKNYIQTQVQATALFKVAGTNQGIYNAAQRFLDQQDEIDSAMAQALEGALRGIIATMPVDELISKREAFQALVVEQVEADLAEQGLQLDILNLSDITTPDSTYLKDRGRAQAAEAKQKAEEAEARTRLASEQARIEADERIAERERDLALKQATIQAETDRARAAANAAGDLARAEQDTLVAREQQAALAERTKVTESGSTSPSVSPPRRRPTRRSSRPRPTATPPRRRPRPRRSPAPRRPRPTRSPPCWTPRRPRRAVWRRPRRPARSVRPRLPRPRPRPRRWPSRARPSSRSSSSRSCPRSWRRPRRRTRTSTVSPSSPPRARPRSARAWPVW